MSGKMTELKTVIISRTDSLGDVMLTLPMAGILKTEFPSCRVIFLGRSYTRPLISCCRHIDQFLDWDELKKAGKNNIDSVFRDLKADAILHVFPDKEIAYSSAKAEIPLRIGTSHRFFHLFTCNRRIHFSRRNSDLHESQLNLKLLKGLGISTLYSLAELNKLSGFNPPWALNPEFASLLSADKFNLILHPRSRGNGREWGLDYFEKLARLLPADRYRIFVSGTREEGDSMRDFIRRNPAITDITGKMNLEEFISFIARANGLVASGTGPLHIASALGKKVVGIFPPIRPIHPGRWAPIGEHASFLVLDKDCSDCRKSGDCQCIRDISPEQVAEKLEAGRK
ncbi:MAG: glycosyltransferase family 9 protein [Bacteroidia bacterium]